ncbi:tRNA (guanine-N(7)-)-methyltransferase-like [Pogoniulus pusillus]|uniref:tRNA (guanine-N(7)-)-methyltransferase-like n=1 Tax=Pogoniulus pusillus TaxID=488313 RepID=UPI0030B99252
MVPAVRGGLRLYLPPARAARLYRARRGICRHRRAGYSPRKAFPTLGRQHTEASSKGASTGREASIPANLLPAVARPAEQAYRPCCLPSGTRRKRTRRKGTATPLPSRRNPHRPRCRALLRARPPLLLLLLRGRGAAAAVQLPICPLFAAASTSSSSSSSSSPPLPAPSPQHRGGRVGGRAATGHTRRAVAPLLPRGLALARPAGTAPVCHPAASRGREEPRRRVKETVPLVEAGPTGGGRYQCGSCPTEGTVVGQLWSLSAEHLSTAAGTVCGYPSGPPEAQ